MKRLFLMTLLALFSSAIFFSGESTAFRCGNGLVSTGDTKSKVRMSCGNPTSIETKCKNKVTTVKSGKTKTKCTEKMEVWYYNCGDNDFIYALTFEGNILSSENPERRGSGKSDCQGK